MEKVFEIAGVEDPMLSVGSRVEIFETARNGEIEEAPHRICRMRVEGNVLVFRRNAGAHPDFKAYDADEGEIVSIERADGRTRFSVRLRP